jgi:hypothetical protein
MTLKIRLVAVAPGSAKRTGKDIGHPETPHPVGSQDKTRHRNHGNPHPE